MDEQGCESSYGMVFAAAVYYFLFEIHYLFQDAAFSLGYLAGSLLGSTVQAYFGFEWLMRSSAILIFVYAPLMLFVPEKAEVDFMEVDQSIDQPNSKLVSTN